MTKREKVAWTPCNTLPGLMSESDVSCPGWTVMDSVSSHVVRSWTTSIKPPAHVAPPVTHPIPLYGTTPQSSCSCTHRLATHSYGAIPYGVSFVTPSVFQLCILKLFFLLLPMWLSLYMVGTTLKTQQKWSHEGWSLVRVLLTQTCEGEAFKRGVLFQQGGGGGGVGGGGGRREVFYRDGLSTGWSFIDMAFHQDGLSTGWSFTDVAFQQGGLSSGRSLNRVVFHWCGLSSGWSFIRMVSQQGGLSLMWPFIRVVSQQGGLSLMWPFIRVVFH